VCGLCLAQDTILKQPGKPFCFFLTVQFFDHEASHQPRQQLDLGERSSAHTCEGAAMSSSRADVIAELVALGLDAAAQHVCGSVRANAPLLCVPDPLTGAVGSHTPRAGIKKDLAKKAADATQVRAARLRVVDDGVRARTHGSSALFH
jgi:hypothetical protein